MKFENTEAWGFEHALRGMRNPMNSHNRSDSGYALPEDWGKQGEDLTLEYRIGKNDLALAQKLIRSGSEHRKFLRQLFVSVDITAPLYWWKEFDTYKVGTTANSTSTMHRLTAKEFAREDFSADTLLARGGGELLDRIISYLNDWRYIYLHFDEMKRDGQLSEDADKKSVWRCMIEFLPSSYNQTRTVTMSYENVLHICRQRKQHKLNEWSGCDDATAPNFLAWARSLPHAKELLFFCETENEGETK